MKRTLVAGCLVAGLAAVGLSGCESTPEQKQPSMDRLNPNDVGMQAKNVREMSYKMFSSMAVKVAEFNERNPNKITVVVYPVTGPAGDNTNYSILTSKMSVEFSRANDRNIVFTDSREFLEGAQQHEFGGGNPDPHEDANRYPPGTPPPSTRLMPQFALYGTVQTMRNNATTYYWVSFKLTRLTPDGRGGEVAWQDGCDLLTLN